ncbi:hypothetical protein [Streptomyces sp. NBC_01435]|uniref:hypothetical protein n=1 Tax=Streptomyces sp. NBC_01435 TaxID=2903865 RepID=UPI002E3759A7|nr:hypothetical protein [Streptomyces sp. NBC_01435]
MRIRSIVSLAASAVAVLALATPSQAVGNGYYLIQDAENGTCLNAGGGALGGQLGDCGQESAWRVVNLPDGSVLFREANDESRCLGLSPLKIFPPAVAESECGNAPDRWLVNGPSSGERVALSLKGLASIGTLTSRGDRATLAGEGEREWDLVRVG